MSDDPEWTRQAQAKIIRTLRGRVEELSKEHDQLKTENANLNKAIELLGAEFDKQQAELITLAQESVERMRHGARMEADILRLRQSVQDPTKTIEALDTARDERDSLKAGLGSLLDEVREQAQDRLRSRNELAVLEWVTEKLEGLL